jgi:hypothetical protein
MAAVTQAQVTALQQRITRLENLVKLLQGQLATVKKG